VLVIGVPILVSIVNAAAKMILTYIARFEK